MVIPAFWNSLHDDTVYPEPDSFKPERWLPTAEGAEPLAESKPQNYIVFGSGPHKVSWARRAYSYSYTYTYTYTYTRSSDPK
jgi:C-22 sterol desaturase